MARIAITTMVRNIDHTFRDWCSYHLQAVDRIFVWLDDPAERHSPHLPVDGRVQVDIGSQHRRGSVHGDFMIRQDQNTQNSLDLCLHQKVDWLIHLDSDELLYPAERAILTRSLPTTAGQVTFLNHEVCPQWQCDHPFRNCHYFKLNGKSAFNLYTNGKAAVRCRPGVYPRDAHSFAGFSGVAVTAREISLLHYACPTYERWLEKYSSLGSFPDFWWDNPDHRITISFHLQSRDIYKRCLDEGNFQPAIDFWSSQVYSSRRLAQLREDGCVGWFAPLGP